MRFKIIKIKKGKPVVIKEALAHNLFKTFSDPDGNEVEQKDEVYKQIWTEVIHDGEINHVSEIIENDVHQFRFGFIREYPGYIDTLKTKNILFQNANYILTILKAKEGRPIGKKGWGYYDIGEEVVIYLKSILALPAAIKALSSSKAIDYDDIVEKGFSK